MSRHSRRKRCPFGEDVVDPAKGQAARFVHFDFLTNRNRLLVGERGTTDWNAMLEIQNRARDIVSRRIVNMGIRPNCEHICSYIRTGGAKSPQLRFWSGVAAVAALGLILAKAK